MTTGIHLDIPATEYHSATGVSASMLRKLWQTTPAHLRADLDEIRRKEFAEMSMGTLAHAMILEPSRPLPGVIAHPDEYEPGKRWTKAAKVCKEWHAKTEAAGLLAISRQQYDECREMALAVAGHEEAKRLLSDGRAEVTCFIETTGLGIPARCRIDFVPNSMPCLVDVKTTDCASEESFTRKAYDLGYHIQAAWYLDLFNSLMPTEKRTGFVFVVIERSAPFAVNVFEASPEFIQRGREDYTQAARTYAECVNSGRWPSYSAQVKSLGIPKWAV